MAGLSAFRSDFFYMYVLIRVWIWLQSFQFEFLHCVEFLPTRFSLTWVCLDFSQLENMGFNSQQICRKLGSWDPGSNNFWGLLFSPLALLFVGCRASFGSLPSAYSNPVGLQCGEYYNLHTEGHRVLPNMQEFPALCMNQSVTLESA